MILEEDVIPIPFDFKTIGWVFDFILHVKEKEPLPEIEKPVPSSRLEDFMPIWYAKYINQLTIDETYDLISAANYMDVQSLVELGCAKVGSMMKNKSVVELRQMFNIVNDFTPEEERSILEGKADIWGEEDDEGDETE